MRLSFTLSALTGRLPGVGSEAEFRAWAASDKLPDPALLLTKPSRVPPIFARRLPPASRMAVDAGLELADATRPDAVVCASRYGEIGRCDNILKTISHDGNVSPTDFAMSVHNAAAGFLTIAGGLKVPVSVVSAGPATFEQSLFECSAMLCDYMRVLLLVFDGPLPEYFAAKCDGRVYDYPYALALMLERGSTLEVSTEDILSGAETDAQTLPAALGFAREFIRAGSFS